jgi:hypothetical protein
MNDELSERLVEANHAIRHLSARGELTQANPMKKLKLSIPSEPCSNNREDEDDSKSEQITSRTEHNAENIHEGRHDDSEGGENQSPEPDMILEWDGRMSIGCASYVSQNERIVLLRKVRRCRLFAAQHV